MVVVVEAEEQARGLVFIMHGLGGYKEQKQLRVVADAFKGAHYTVVAFDTTNTFGESDGRLDDATTTNYIEDLEDVIVWSSTQSWYTEPFVLVGHSLGGISVITYAERNMDKIRAIAPMSSVISGELSVDDGPSRMDKWKEVGYEEQQSGSRPWLKAKIPWSHMEDRLKYDVLKGADRIKVPVLLVVGSADDITPVKHQQLFFDRIGSEKEIHVIDGAPHTFKEDSHLQQLREIFTTWIQKI